MTHEEYVARDATGLAELVRTGQVTAMELLEIALARIDALDPKLNAVVRLMEEDARHDAARQDRAPREPARQDAARPEAPRRPFSGVPFLAKDIISTYAGHPTSSGSRLLAGHVWSEDSELVRRVRATGVSIAGKTNLPEWGLLPVTESELWGPCRNPWDPSRSPGGSSGGSAAAVAAGMVPMAGASDGGGSIRIPASCCGLFGLKPTRGRTPTGPVHGQLWRGAVVEHVLSRSVRDSARMLDALRGADPGAPCPVAEPDTPYGDSVERDPGRLRIAWSSRPTLGSSVHPDCVAAAHDAVTLLEDLGHELVEAEPVVEGAAFARSFLVMVAAELGADLDDVTTLLGRRPRRGELEPATWALGLLSRSLPAPRLAAALRHLERVGRTLGQFFEQYDLWLSPTLATPPPAIGALGPTSRERTILRVLGAFGSGRLVRAAGLLEQVASDAFEFIPWTPIANVTGQPAMSVPLFWNDDGLPIGVHFTARFGDEQTLLRLAGQLERARPWLDRLPLQSL